MKFKFCPECGYKLDGEYKFCPECGYKLSDTNNNEVKKEEKIVEDFPVFEDSFDFDLESAFDDQIKAKEKKEKKYADVHKKALNLILRGEYEDAIIEYDFIVDKDRFDMQAYIGLIRAKSQNYTVFEGEDLEEEINFLNETFPEKDIKKDKLLVDYFNKRQQYFVDEALKAKEKEAKAKQKIKDDYYNSIDFHYLDKDKEFVKFGKYYKKYVNYDDLPLFSGGARIEKIPYAGFSYTADNKRVTRVDNSNYYYVEDYVIWRVVEREKDKMILVMADVLPGGLSVGDLVNVMFEPKQRDLLIDKWMGTYRTKCYMLYPYEYVKYKKKLDDCYFDAMVKGISVNFCYDRVWRLENDGTNKNYVYKFQLSPFIEKDIKFKKCGIRRAITIDLTKLKEFDY